MDLKIVFMQFKKKNILGSFLVILDVALIVP